MDAILPHALSLVQSSLNTEVCPGFHRVVLVVLSEIEQTESFKNSTRGKSQSNSLFHVGIVNKPQNHTDGLQSGKNKNVSFIQTLIVRFIENHKE